MKHWPVSLWILVGIAVVGSAISLTGNRAIDVWVFEMIPGLVGIVGLLVCARWLAFSALTYSMIGFSLVLMELGAHYTYAEMPLFNWLRDEFGLARNHFDRFGHFFQGLTVGLMVREILVRKTSLGRRWGVPVLSVAFALAFSAFYELSEWWVVLLFYPEHGADWLGLQGDPWDAHWDMTLALAGSIVAVVLLASLQDRSIHRRIQQPTLRHAPD